VGGTEDPAAGGRREVVTDGLVDLLGLDEHHRGRWLDRAHRGFPRCQRDVLLPPVIRGCKSSERGPPQPFGGIHALAPRSRPWSVRGLGTRHLEGQGSRLVRRNSRASSQPHRGRSSDSWLLANHSAVDSQGRWVSLRLLVDSVPRRHSTVAKLPQLGMTANHYPRQIRKQCRLPTG
jgi:hypothetical protein